MSNIWVLVINQLFARKSEGKFDIASGVFSPVRTHMDFPGFRRKHRRRLNQNGYGYIRIYILYRQYSSRCEPDSASFGMNFKILSQNRLYMNYHIIIILYIRTYILYFDLPLPRNFPKPQISESAGPPFSQFEFFNTFRNGHF